MPKVKFKTEQNEAQYCAQRGILPHKIKTDEPTNLMNSLMGFFRRRKIHDVAVSRDPDGDAVWLRKR